MKYSVVIPVYRGAKTIVLLFQKVQAFFEAEGLAYEVIFVHDCGPDNSWSVIRDLKQQYPNEVKGVQLSRNFGQHNATICGFKYAEGDFMITMDEDLQHNPQDILYLIRKQQEQDYDVVYGIYEERKHNIFRNTTSYLLNRMLAIGIPELHKDYTSFRLIRARIARETLKMNNSYTFLDGYLTWITNKVASTGVSHSEGQAGKSSYSLKKLVEHSINIFVTFSRLPIRILTVTSIIILLLSCLYSFYILVRKVFFNDLIPGFATINIVCGLGFGFLLFGLGIIGEYIQRINLKTTKRPNFLEAQSI
ncbi:glycosyltransferase family 2 protein [Paraflavisolibacter sp. H34]|uniref:glycosyltransferase family 2 protein n=1 Tax=Huijunlia imazamoxiresistens TaxID=3127457 RepID=UPI00301AD666